MKREAERCFDGGRGTFVGVIFVEVEDGGGGHEGSEGEDERRSDISGPSSSSSSSSPESAVGRSYAFSMGVDGIWVVQM